MGTPALIAHGEPQASAALSRGTVQGQGAGRDSALGLAADAGRMPAVQEEKEGEAEEQKKTAGEGLGGDMFHTAEVRIGAFVDDPYEYDDGGIGDTSSEPGDYLGDGGRDPAEVK